MLQCSLFMHQFVNGSCLKLIHLALTSPCQVLWFNKALEMLWGLNGAFHFCQCNWSLSALYPLLNKENMRSAKRFVLYYYIRQHMSVLYDFTCSYCIYVGSRHLFQRTLHAQWALAISHCIESTFWIFSMNRFTIRVPLYRFSRQKLESSFFRTCRNQLI